MYKYEYVKLGAKKGFNSANFVQHREIIDDYAQRGYRFVGYIPTKEVSFGMLVEIDLVFEKCEGGSV